ncbi:MAG: hypothetical protein ACR2JO_07890 [Mycobacteriales bacterium]
MSVDRLSKGYEPRWDIDLAAGQQGELFVADLIKSLASGSASVEVKTDEAVAKTGNVYVEYQCLRSGQWHDSGISATQADLWAFVLPARVLIVAPVSAVREIARRNHARYRRECVRGSHPTRGVAIPVGRFVMELYQYDVPTPLADTG